MFYIVGLGNPGDKYINTRHNVGRMVLEEMSDNSLIKDKPSNASIASMSLGGEVIQLFAPETFMNNSGETVKYIVSKLGAVTEDVIVVHDDIDLPFGEVKVAKGRGAGGNNGVESIIKQLKSKNFVRVR
ncbi:aminoacyl-tRNA hydrolase, partial [Candidatus Kaiserbacteria bacterium]|nr:aminoacyl-tRNA hydrolase [Candidatus Kaiserbacteria bacterium]